MRALFVVICFFLMWESTRASSNTSLEELEELSAASPVISINTQIFLKYIKPPAKEYSFIVLFVVLNSDSGNICENCEDIYAQFLAIAGAYMKSTSDHKLFFGVADFVNAPKVFDIMNIAVVPNVVLFQPGRKHTQSDFMDIANFGIDAFKLCFFIEKRTHIRIKVDQDVPVSTKIITLFYIGIGASYVYMHVPFKMIVRKIYDRKVWASAALFACTLFMSGQMSNYINNEQLPVILESVMIAGLMIASMYGFICAIEAAGGVTRRRRKMDKDKIYAGLVAFFVGFMGSLIIHYKKIATITSSPEGGE